MGEFGQKSKADENQLNNSVADLKKSWQTWAKEHMDYQKQNPFSNVIQPGTAQPDTQDPEYGKPKAGTLTEKRGKDAHRHLGKEAEQLCLVIRNIGITGEDGLIKVTFGKLFDAYVTISNKLVGILLRARKHGLLDFEGEMLWQGRDDHVVITLLE
ncbi:actin-binding Rho-activating protein-like [Leptodactylus fuscus]